MNFLGVNLWKEERLLVEWHNEWEWIFSIGQMSPKFAWIYKWGMKWFVFVCVKYVRALHENEKLDWVTNVSRLQTKQFEGYTISRFLKFLNWFAELGDGISWISGVWILTVCECLKAVPIKFQ